MKRPMEDFIIKSPDIVQKCRQLIVQKTAAKQQGDGPTETSESFRKRANVMYKSNKSKLQDALLLYTLSVRVADPDSEDLTLALGNRSAVTFELKQYESCLRDVENVLMLGPSSSLLKRLLIRKARCLVQLGHLNSCRQEADCLGELRTSLTTDTSQALAEDPQGVRPQGVHGGPHKSLPAASDLIEMKESERKGRYLQVNSAVSSGCTLIRERPYTTVLLPDYWTTHCYHCLTPVLYIPIFCRSKSCMARFCTIRCLRIATESYHKYECRHLDIVVSTGIGHLAYRVITHTGYQTLVEHREALAKKTTSDENSDGLEAYDAVYNLVTNSQHIQPEDLHQYKETALLLLMCLIDSRFFPSSHALTDPDVVYIGTLLLRHIEQLICNAHAVTVMSSSDSPRGSDEMVYRHSQDKMATAIYPTASRMNHSCKPNIIASFLGSELIVRTSEDLKAGDEVFNCYGPHYQKMERADRQQSLLTQYYFTCECEPCQQEQGQVSSLKCLCCLECQGRSLLISDSEAKCQECKTVYYAGGQINNLVTATQILEDAKAATPRQGLDMVRKAKGILLGQVVHKHSMDMANAFDQEAQCLASLGDMRSCADALLSSIAIIEQLYPEHSIERAHEYRKLSEVLCATQQYPRALAYARKARTIFVKQYSESHELVNDIDELCEQIRAVNVSS